MKYKRQKPKKSISSDSGAQKSGSVSHRNIRFRATVAGIIIIALFSFTRIGFIEKNLVKNIISSDSYDYKPSGYVDLKKFFEKLGKFTSEFCFGYLRNDDKGSKAYATDSKKTVTDEADVVDEAVEGVEKEVTSDVVATDSEAMADSNSFEAILPCNGSVSSPFGNRVHPVTGVTTNHNGVDIACSSGTKVMAVCDGVVDKAQYNEYSGNFVVVSHCNGFTSSYAHLSKISVSPGQKISTGDEIGKSGSTGMVTGPHLHFEIRQNGDAVNPFEYITGD